jgi:hypothetical protein
MDDLGFLPATLGWDSWLMQTQCDASRAAKHLQVNALINVNGGTHNKDVSRCAWV